MSGKPRALISACLLGVQCRYDGAGQSIPGVSRLLEQYELIPVCPEQLGGLPTPRIPAERLGDRVLTRDGADVTDAFVAGAEQTRRLAELFGAKLAILKARSPSCGCETRYDGSFSGRLVPGMGVAAEYLAAAGVRLLSEEQLNAPPDPRAD